MAPPRRALPHNASVPEPHPPLRWDIFCQVIDNHGDLGVCWRLATALAAREQQVRLWVDAARALGVRITGLHAHLGSGIESVGHWQQVVDDATISGELHAIDEAQLAKLDTALARFG